MENLFFTKGKRMRSFIALLVLAVLLIWLGWLLNDLWYSAASKSKREAPPQSVMEKGTPVPPKPIAATSLPQQKTASAASPCCCPCPQKTRAAVHPKKKKVQQPKPAPPVTSETAIASGTKGCVEIHFTTKPGDTVVKFPVFGPADSSIAKDACTAIKHAGDPSFGPWQNSFCSTAQPILCDFSQHERIIGKKVLLMGSYRVEKQGEHVLRLPGFIAERDSGYVTALILVRGRSEHPQYPNEQPGDAKAFVAASKYGEQRQEWIVNNPDAIGVRWFDFTNGIARVYYSKAEVPKGAAQLYWPWGEWRGP